MGMSPRGEIASPCGEVTSNPPTTVNKVSPRMEHHRQRPGGNDEKWRIGSLAESIKSGRYARAGCPLHESVTHRFTAIPSGALGMRIVLITSSVSVSMIETLLAPVLVIKSQRPSPAKPTP